MSRYSQLYVERGARSEDSQRARVRIGALFEIAVPIGKWRDVVQDVALVQGIKIVNHDLHLIKRYFVVSEIRDVLDAVTVISSVLINDGARRELWLRYVEKIFDEEHLSYKIDDNGIVHPFIDAEFEANRVSALAALDQPRFQSARAEFDAAFRHLRDGNGREALRMMFPAVETTARVLFPGRFAGLAANEVERYIKPVLDKRYAGNEPALTAGRLLLVGMKQWINSAHVYRHGQEIEEVAEPPKDFVIAHISAGATYLRWIIDLCCS